LKKGFGIFNERLTIIQNTSKTTLKAIKTQLLGTNSMPCEKWIKKFINKKSATFKYRLKIIGPEPSRGTI
jgi:hypothetical protein